MPRLIWVYTVCTTTLLVFSCRGSFVDDMESGPNCGILEKKSFLFFGYVNLIIHFHILYALNYFALLGKKAENKSHAGMTNHQNLDISLNQLKQCVKPTVRKTDFQLVNWIISVSVCFSVPIFTIWIWSVAIPDSSEISRRRIMRFTSAIWYLFSDRTGSKIVHYFLNSKLMR